jgi:hypothetical protein
MNADDLSDVSNAELYKLWSRTMRELRRRGLVRSSNNPVADIAERLAADRLGASLVAQSVRGYDAVDVNGIRYQVKSRRLTPENSSRQLSFIRNLDAHEFDFLVIVLFDEILAMLGMWKLPHSLVTSYARWSPHVNGHILRADDRVLADPEVERLL